MGGGDEGQYSRLLRPNSLTHHWIVSFPWIRKPTACFLLPCSCSPSLIFDLPLSTDRGGAATYHDLFIATVREGRKYCFPFFCFLSAGGGGSLCYQATLLAQIPLGGEGRNVFSWPRVPASCPPFLTSIPNVS